MPRSLILAAIGAIVLSTSGLLADEGKKPKALDNSEVQKVDKGAKQKGGDKNADKVKRENQKGEKTESKKTAKGQKPKGDEKKIADKQPAKDGIKVAAKEGEKKIDKAQQAVAVIGSDTQYYTTSPAQGRPADGTLQAGTKVRVVEKAGSYVRVVAEIEAFVSVDSLKVVEKKDASEKKAVEKKDASEKKAVEKKQDIQKAANDKEAAL